MNIHAFKALRPPVDLADKVASLPYDVGELPEARKLASANPRTFLHVERPEVDLPDQFADGADHAAAAGQLALFKSQGWLVQDAAPALYVYRQSLGSHVQTGVMACCHVEDYWNDLVKKHEKTKKPVEDQRTRHVLATNANTGPIFLLYRDEPAIDRLVADITARTPDVDFTAVDGIRHTIWNAPASGPLQAAFQAVPQVYVADGHHRAAAAARAGRERRAANPAHTGQEEYNWFMASLFPASQLKILAYNRLMKDLHGLSPAEFMDVVRRLFKVQSGVSPLPAAPRQISMYCAGAWHGLSWEADPQADPVSALDVSVLQSRLLGPVLGIDDPRTNNRIGYLGGLDVVAELKRRVDAGEAAVAFSMYPTTVDQLMAISDAGQIMPPKSTWFEPKLRSGLFVHLLD